MEFCFTSYESTLVIHLWFVWYWCWWFKACSIPLACKYSMSKHKSDSRLYLAICNAIRILHVMLKDIDNYQTKISLFPLHRIYYISYLTIPKSIFTGTEHSKCYKYLLKYLSTSISIIIAIDMLITKACIFSPLLYAYHRELYALQT